MELVCMVSPSVGRWGLTLTAGARGEAQSIYPNYFARPGIMDQWPLFQKRAAAPTVVAN